MYYQHSTPNPLLNTPTFESTDDFRQSLHMHTTSVPRPSISPMISTLPSQKSESDPHKLTSLKTPQHIPSHEPAEWHSQSQHDGRLDQHVEHLIFKCNRFQEWCDWYLTRIRYLEIDVIRAKDIRIVDLEKELNSLRSASS